MLPAPAPLLHQRCTLKLPLAQGDCSQYRWHSYKFSSKPFCLHQQWQRAQLRQTRAHAQAQALTSGTRDPRSAVFFPESLYRPEDYVTRLCTLQELPEQVSKAIIKELSKGKYPTKASKLKSLVKNAKGIIERLTPEVAIPLMARYPYLLRNTPERLTERLIFCSSLLGCSMQQALTMARRYPMMFNVRTQQIQSHYEALQQTFQGRFSQQDIRMLLVTTPALLGMKPASLRRKVQLLQFLASQFGQWEYALATAKPSCIAVLLTYSELRVMRLQYLHDVQRMEDCAFFAAVMKPEAWFAARYPGWVEWAAQLKISKGAHARAGGSKRNGSSSSSGATRAAKLGRPRLQDALPTSSSWDL